MFTPTSTNHSAFNTSYPVDMRNSFPPPLNNEQKCVKTFEQKVTKRSFIMNAFICMAAGAIFGAARYAINRASNSTGELSQQDPLYQNRMVTPAVIPLASISTSAGRKLLSNPTITSLISSQTMTEEVPFTQQWSTCDVFRSSDVGELSISAKQSNGAALPKGLSVVNRPMQLLNTIFLSTYNLKYHNGYFFGISGSLFTVVDATDPSNLNIIFSNSLGITLTGAKNMAFKGNLCYLVTGKSWIGNTPPGALTIIDISTPSAPSIKSQIALGHDITSSSISINIINNFCFILGGQETTSVYKHAQIILKTIDVSDYLNPFIVNSPPPPLQVGTADDGRSFAAISNTHLYLVAPETFPNKLFAVDISQPSAPSNFTSLISLPGAINSLEIVNNTAFIATTGGLYILDLHNATKPVIMSSFALGQSISAMTVEGNYCFISTNHIQKIDVSDPRNPIMCTSLPTVSARYMKASSNNLYLYSTNLLSSYNSVNTFDLAGTPAGNTKGNYSIDFTANNPLGGSMTETVDLTIKPAITLSTRIPNQKAIVGSFFNFMITAFNQVNNNPLTYTAKLANSSNPLPQWLALNPVSGTFSGTPTSSDTGVVELEITARDSSGASATTHCQMTILNGPTLNSPIPNQVTTIDNPFSFTAAKNTFMDKDGYPLTYTATGSGTTLPDWLSFNPKNLTFSGTPSLLNEGVTPISLIAQDPVNTTLTTTFTINVVAESQPILTNPISTQSAMVGQSFEFIVPSNTFQDPYANKITYSAALNGGSPLPSWLSFNPKSRTFSGTPSYGDTDAFSAHVLQILLTAKGIKAVQTTTFNINVSGTSYEKIVLSVLGPIISIATAVFGAYRARGALWNKFKKATYTKPDETAFIQQPYAHSIPIPTDQVKLINALFKGKNFSSGASLPHWLYYDAINNVLRSDSIPDPKALTPIKIQVIDRVGRIQEEFNLHIKSEEEAPLFIQNPLSIRLDENNQRNAHTSGDIELTMRS